jgi:Mrp family chromosome partitioning ATPase
VASPLPAAPTRPTIPHIPNTPPTPEPIDSRILSVTFHRFPRQGLRVMDHGVAPEIVVYHFPDHPVSAEYRLVRDEIIQQYPEPGSRSVLFTSAAHASGTSTVLLNYAVALAQDHGHRVLVIDGNFGRPGIARRLSAAESPGLAEVLGQTLPLAWALQPTPILNLHVLASGQPTDNTESALLSDFPRLMMQLRQWFDWVILDAGIWTEFAHTENLLAQVDGIYLVTREDDLDRADFVTMRTDLQNEGAPVRGYIATRQ